MSKRRKLKAPTSAEHKQTGTHDRIAQGVVIGMEIGIVEIEDAYAMPELAKANGRGEWVVPPRDKVRVAQSFRHDPIGKMHARHQIGKAEYDAARDLQRLHDNAQIGVIKAMDPGKVVVDGGMLPDVLTDHQKKAIDRIRAVEKALREAHGRNGLDVLNGVVVHKMTVEAVAAHKGYLEPKKVDYWRGLFRECLHTLGREMGTIRARAA